MRIAILGPLDAQWGGVQQVSRTLKDVLLAEGHQVELIDPSNKKEGWIFKKAPVRAALTLLARYSTSLKQNYDLVICNGEYAVGVHHPRCINLFHGTYFGYRKNLHDYLTARQHVSLKIMSLVQRFGARGKQVVAVSEFVSRHLQDQGIKVDRVIHNCVDTALFRPLQGVVKNDHLLAVGRHDYYGKGFDILERLSSRGFTVDCVTDVDPGPGMRWINVTSPDQLVRVYDEHRILVHPSRFEGFGLVSLEAMACGIPILMGNVGIGIDIKKKFPEFVVETESRNAVDAYAERIGFLLDTYDRYPSACRQFVIDNFNIGIFRQEWVSVVKNAGE
jgi:glycosyltransferase involved in cell wall biosynthesis